MFCCLYGKVYTVAAAIDGGFCICSILVAGLKFCPFIGTTYNSPGPIIFPGEYYFFFIPNFTMLFIKDHFASSFA